MALSCIEQSAGLAPFECPCDGAMPQGANDSASGYYIVDEEFGFPARRSIAALKDCEDGGFWAILARAKAEAARDFENDISAAMRRSRVAGPNVWSGTIGVPQSNRYAPVSTGLAGVEFFPRKEYRDLSIVLTHIWAGFRDSGTFNVTVNSTISGWTPIVRQITAVGGQWNLNELSAPIVLPMYGYAPEYVEHIMSYDRADSGDPLVNKKDFCCGARVMDIPGRLPRSADKKGWFKQFDMRGFLTSSTGQKQRNESHLYGLAFEGYFDCDSLAFLCRANEYGGADVNSLLGRGLVYKAAIRLLEAAEQSEAITQASLLNAQERAARIGRYLNEYNELLSFIADHAPIADSSCWSCRKGGLKISRVNI